jgi:hypothetical protein
MRRGIVSLPPSLSGLAVLRVFSDPAPITKYLVLHFTAVSLEGGDQFVVNLGYGTDVFTAASGSEFWTRPIHGNSTTITYVDDGDGVGSVTLNQYGRGEESDVFMLSTPYVNPAVLFANAVWGSGGSLSS